MLRHFVCFVIVVVFGLLLAGCGGGGSAPSPLESTRAMTAQAATDTVPVGNDAVSQLDGQTATEESMLDSDTDLTRAAGTEDWDYQGLHFHRVWNGNPADATFDSTITVTGTTAAGVTVNLTRGLQIDRVAGTRMLAISGTLIKGGVTYTVDIHRNVAIANGIRTLSVNSTISKSGVEIYHKQITRAVILADAAPRQRTQSGIVVVHNPQNPSEQVTITFNALQYTPNAQTKTLTYQGGSVDLADSLGRTAHLTPSNGVLTGTVFDAQQQAVGTMTIGNGAVTITK